MTYVTFAPNRALRRLPRRGRRESVHEHLDYAVGSVADRLTHGSNTPSTRRIDGALSCPSTLLDGVDEALGAAR